MYPALTGSKTPTSKFSGSKEVRWGINCPSTFRKSPIGSTNNQWGMNKTLKVSLYYAFYYALDYNLYYKISY
ncbi:hypothetical protein DN398_00710 [Bacillus sp. JAS102]|nr:hypothetical protein DN398_00710 [Bacillus sp. JAS102]